MKNNSIYTAVKKQPFKRIAFSLTACLLLLMTIPVKTFAGDDPVLPYDEILVFMNVQGVGNVQVAAAIRNETAYLAITDVFDFLKIKNNPSDGRDSITGFYITPQAKFVIDKI